MIKTEIIKAKIENRILVTDAPIFSGESVQIRLDFNCGNADATKHKIVLFGAGKKALAEASFFANADGVWIANLNTATKQMAGYFEGVEAEGAKSLGAMIVNAETADVISRGNVLVVSTPFPSELVPCPQTYAYVTSEELSSSMAEVETEISSKADASDFIQLSSMVADIAAEVESKADAMTVEALATDIAAKAESSTVADLSSDVAFLHDVTNTQYFMIQDKAASSDVANIEQSVLVIHDELFALSSTVADKAESSDFGQLSSTVDELENSIANKAEASDLNDLALEVEYIGQGLAEKAESSTVAALSSTVASKANASTVAALSSTVANKADADSVLPNSDTAFLNGNLFIIETEYATDALQVRWFGFEVYPGGGESYQVTMPLSSGRLVVDSQLASKADSSTVAALASRVAQLEQIIRA